MTSAAQSTHRFQVLPVGAALAGLALGGCLYGSPEPLGDEEREVPSDAEVIETCEAAAERLEQCTGDVPPDFIDACTHDPDEDSLEAIDEILASDCDDIPADMSADGFFEGAFAAACRPAVATAYLVTRQRNPNSESLTASQKRELRPYFGSLVDHARVHWDAALINSWSVAGAEIEFTNIAAQAFGLDIYMAQDYRPNNTNQLALTAHELTHTWQAVRLGSMHAFADEYCRGYYRAGFSYRDNDFEVEARDVQDYVRDCIRDGGC